MRDIQKQLQEMRTVGEWNADRAYLGRNRESLFRVIKTGAAGNSPSGAPSFIDRFAAGLRIFVPHSVLGAARPLASVIGVGILAIGGWVASVSASYNSVPGDVLYNVKLTAEKTQTMVVAVTGSGEAKAQMHLEFAARRAEEVKQVVAKEKPEHATVAIESLKKSIAAAGDTVKDAQKGAGQTDGVEKTVALAKNVNEKSGEIVTTLNEVLKDTTAKGDIELTKEVVAVTKIVNETSIAAVEVAVESVIHKTQGVDTAAQEGKNLQEVKNLVAEKIETIVQEQKVAGDVVAEVKTSAPQTAPAPLPAPALTSTSTSSTVLTPSTTPELRIEQVVQKATESSAAAKGVIEEAKTLVENNQLLEAIVKVKEANQVTQEVKQVVVEVQQAVKEKIATDLQKAASVPQTLSTSTPSAATSTQPVLPSPTSTPAPDTAKKQP